jgi:hypothetical protein
VASWILAQVSDLAASNLNFPDWFVPMVLVVLAFGFPIVVIFAWAFEMTPEGLKKTSEMDRTRSITPGTGKNLNIPQHSGFCRNGSRDCLFRFR